MIANNKTKKFKITPMIIGTLIAMICASTCSVLSFKMQGQKYNFKHGLFQTVLMFIGEFMNLIIFFGRIAYSPTATRKHLLAMDEEAKENNQSLQFTKLWIAIPCLIDMAASTCSLVSLLLMPASINTMFNGGIIVFTTIISRLIIKRPIMRHQALGCTFSAIGFVIVGISATVFKPMEDGYTLQGTILGIILTLIYLVLVSFQGNIEELIVRRKAIDVQRMIGLEGMFGMIWALIAIMIASFIPCPSDGLCSMGGYFEDPVMAVMEIATQPGLAFFCFTAACAVLVLNLTGLYLVKATSVVFKVFWSTLNIMVIWAVSVLLGLEGFDLNSALVQMFGFVFLLLGNFTYSEIIVWPVPWINVDIRKRDGDGIPDDPSLDPSVPNKDPNSIYTKEE